MSILLNRKITTPVDEQTFDRLHALAKQEHSTAAREARLAILDRINARLGDPSPGHSVRAELDDVARQGLADERLLTEKGAA